MSRLLCCLRARHADMGAALSHPQEGEVCDGAGLPVAPPTMADVIRERKKKAGGAGLGTLRRRIANAARRPRDARPDRGCEHARFIRLVVSSWRLPEVFLLCEELEAGAALRDLAMQADLAREPAPALSSALPLVYTDRWWCDVELVGAGWALAAHRAILAARSSYFRDLLQRYPPSCVRVPLEGACAALAREEADAALYALYAGAPPRRHHCRHHKYDGSEHGDGDLDLVDNTNSCLRTGSLCACSARRGGGGGGGGGGGAEGVGREGRRAAALFGATRDPLQTSMRYLLDSGEMSDAKLVFRLEGGCGVAYGFRTAFELPCHRAVLAARSRFFRTVMSRRSSNSSTNNGSVCVDEKVLPRRFARALLHAAYTDQVDLSLIGRNSTLPATTTTGAATAWAGVARGGGATRLTVSGLDDAFQLYEIARFLEMPIVVQGCEDAIAEALCPDTLAHVLRWAAAPHASQWVHRQAMRYLRDEFVPIVSSGAAASVPRAALAAALASPFLQASETAALRALLRWGADHKHKQREPNVVWHTAHSVSRRGARRRSLGDAALRDILAPLVQHVRTEHVPRDNELLNQLVRRGIVPAPPPPAEEAAHAWLGRGSARPARIFLPYLDEIKALLEDQAVPEVELARARRARYMHRIPDTLYMVAAARDPSPAPAGGGAGGGAGAAAARGCVGARAAAALRARVRELRCAPAARTAATHAPHADRVHKQIALRAVREMSLPDACADLLLDDIDTPEPSEEAWDSPRTERRRPDEPDDDPARDCCRTLGSVRCASAGSLSARESALDNSRTGSCSRRELAPRPDAAHHRAGAADGGRLSAAVPDVAMAPNANTHLLTARDYFRHPPPWEYGGVVLQLDLGDGATHTPRPGSRAQRNSAAHAPRVRDHAPVAQCPVLGSPVMPPPPQAPPCPRARAAADELRAAIELSVMRAYSSFHGRGGSPPGARRGGSPPGGAGSARRAPSAPASEPPGPPTAATLPPPFRNEPGTSGLSPRGRAPAPSPAPHLALARLSPAASPHARRRRYAPHPHHDYRLEAGSYGSASTSRGHSPNNYA